MVLTQRLKWPDWLGGEVAVRLGARVGSQDRTVSSPHAKGRSPEIKRAQPQAGE